MECLARRVSPVLLSPVLKWLVKERKCLRTSAHRAASGPPHRQFSRSHIRRWRVVRLQPARRRVRLPSSNAPPKQVARSDVIGSSAASERGCAASPNAPPARQERQSARRLLRAPDVCRATRTHNHADRQPGSCPARNTARRASDDAPSRQKARPSPRAAAGISVGEGRRAIPAKAVQRA